MGYSKTITRYGVDMILLSPNLKSLKKAWIDGVPIAGESLIEMINKGWNGNQTLRFLSLKDCVKDNSKNKEEQEEFLRILTHLQDLFPSLKEVEINDLLVSKNRNFISSRVLPFANFTLNKKALIVNDLKIQIRPLKISPREQQKVLSRREMLGSKKINLDVMKALMGVNVDDIYSLNVQDAEFFDDRGLYFLFKKPDLLQTLLELNLNRSFISAQGLKSVFSSALMKCLKFLSTVDCSRITEAERKSQFESLKSQVIISYHDRMAEEAVKFSSVDFNANKLTWISDGFTTK